MDYATVRFPTDSTDSALLEAAAGEGRGGSASIHHSRGRRGIGNGLDIKVVLERPDGEAEAFDAIERSLPEGISIEVPPVPEIGDPSGLRAARREAAPLTGVGGQLAEMALLPRERGCGRKGLSQR